MDLRLRKKTAIITGAGGGIGAGAALRLAREGANVVVADIDGDKAAAVADDIRGEGGMAIGVATDVTNADAVWNLVGACGEAFGGADILVNNAGFTRDNRIGNMPESDWDAVIGVVLKGAYLCTKAALPSMIERRWGRILNISSRAHLGNRGQANYSAAKAGIIGFTRAMSLENGRFNITCNAIAPGIIGTEMVKQLPHYDSIRENAERTTPIPRVGTVEDVADLIAFLASDLAGYISGDVVHVSGGRY